MTSIEVAVPVTVDIAGGRTFAADRLLLVPTQPDIKKKVTMNAKCNLKK